MSVVLIHVVVSGELHKVQLSRVPTIGEKILTDHIGPVRVDMVIHLGLSYEIGSLRAPTVSATVHASVAD